LPLWILLKGQRWKETIRLVERDGSHRTPDKGRLDLEVSMARKVNDIRVETQGCLALSKLENGRLASWRSASIMDQQYVVNDPLLVLRTEDYVAGIERQKKVM
jgi:hypothetical protein